FNVVKHAKTGEARVEMTRASPDIISIEVVDRGCGFDLDSTFEKIGKSPKFGLLNMQERLEGLGGQCEIYSKKEEGTRVRITIPLYTRFMADPEADP
ncbi:MAG TPA: hypothetical protein DD706_17660, partial [Nitrospiraceae bacterium]|nr:hypothetical protein [Nitrospiraceae bacterium]